MTSDDLKDEQARGDFLRRLKTTMRWRENKDKIKESNARIVRWSDGSETFHVGAEVFDVMHHKVIDDKNHLYVRLENCYQAQGSITDKMTLRPKLDSTFGQSHVQGLRNRAMNKPQTGVVKVLSDLVANPLTDRDRRAKEEIANLRREEREKRREVQMSMRKPRVKPMRHCTADDSDPEQAAGERDDLESVSGQSVCASSTGRSSTQGIRTNRNTMSTDEEDEEDGYDSDVNDIINDDDLDGDDEEMSDEPSTSTSKSKKAPLSRHSSKSDSDDGPKTRILKRKSKRLIFSDSDSD
ncbi:hypothetical protein KR038_001926 [Drosophila bunnanda]|nr:hypothetical protein KR038_001926 [Drosophila bunnanda]